MATLLQVQLSVFGDFAKFEASTESFSIILKEFDDFLPMATPAYHFDLKNNKFTTVQRIKIINPQTGWTIFVEDERVNATFEMNDTLEGVNFADGVKSGLALLTKFLRIIMPGTMYSRLAINSRQAIEHGTTKPPIPFVTECPDYMGSEVDLKEWTISTNRESSIKLNTEEKLNEIVTLSLGHSAPEPGEYATLILYDINTIPEESAARFTIDHMETFSSYIIERVSTIEAELEKRIHHGA